MSEERLSYSGPFEAMWEMEVEKNKNLQARVEELEKAIDGLSIIDMGNYCRVTKDSMDKLGRTRAVKNGLQIKSRRTTSF